MMDVSADRRPWQRPNHLRGREHLLAGRRLSEQGALHFTMETTSKVNGEHTVSFVWKHSVVEECLEDVKGNPDLWLKGL